MNPAVERIFEDFLIRENDPAAAFEALCAAQPQHEQELRALFRGYRRVIAMLEPDADPTTDSERGSDELGRYEVRAEIARGGMGRVLEVWDAELRRVLAMKVLHEQPSDAVREARARSRLVHEAQVLGQLDHPGIVPVHELGEDAAGRPFFTMQRVRGRTLDAVFDDARAERDGWNLTRAVSVLLRACEAIAHAHDRGVLHRDLKPANVMVGPFGEVYVMDWGLAKACDRTVDVASAGGNATEQQSVRTDRTDESGELPASPLLTMEGDVVGTPAYMSPEQAEGHINEVGERSDVYSLGAMLYHLLSGAPPYAGSTSTPRQVLDAVLTGSPEPLERIAPRPGSPELAAICARAMNRESASRYIGVVEFADDLRAYLEGRVVRAHATGPIIELRKWVQRNRGSAAAVAAIALGIIAVLVLQYRANLDVTQRAEALRLQVYHNDVAFAQNALVRGDVAGLQDLLARCPKDLRGWEWRCLNRMADTSAARLAARGWSVGNPSGTRLLTATREGMSTVLHLADATNNLSPLWATDLDRRWASAPVFSASGEEIYLTEFDRSSSSMTALRAADGTIRRSVPSTDGKDASLCVSPDGEYLATATDGGLLELWSTDPLALVERIDDGIRGYISPCWSNDGTLLAVGTRRVHHQGRASEVRVYDMRTRTLRCSLRGHEDWVYSVAISSDGTWVASTGADRRVLLWDLADGSQQPRQLGPVTSDLPVVVCSPEDRRLLSTCNGRILVWDTRTWTLEQELVGLRGRASRPTFLTDGRVAATDEFETLVWQIERRDRVTEAVTRHGKGILAFSPDGETLAFAEYQGVVEFWNVAGRRLRRRSKIASDRAHLAFLPDGERLLTLDQQGWLRIFDSDTDEQLGQVRAHGHRAGMVGHVLPHPDGRRCITTGWDGRVRSWDLENLEPLWTVRAGLPDWPSGAHSIAMTPTGDLIAIGAADGCLRVLATATGRVVHKLAVSTEQLRYNDAVFSPDGRVVVAVRVTPPIHLIAWDTMSGELLWQSQAHLDHNWPRFTADGTRLLTATKNGGVSVREAATGTRIAALERDINARCQAFALSPDGTTAALLTRTKRLRFWSAADW